jgi:hypothetical protein
MAELSPAAQAVLTAVTLTKYDVPPEGLPAFAEEMAPLLAAALRAAADQVVIKLAGLGQESAWYLEEIAAELEAQ